MIDQLAIVDGDPRHPEAFRLLQASHKLLSELFPQDDIYALSLDELCEENVKFYVAIGNDCVIKFLNCSNALMTITLWV